MSDRRRCSKDGTFRRRFLEASERAALASPPYGGLGSDLTFQLPGPSGPNCGVRCDQLAAWLTAQSCSAN